MDLLLFEFVKFIKIGGCNINQGTQQINGCIQIHGFIYHERQGKTGAVVGENFAVAVVNNSTRWRNGFYMNAVVF